MLYYTHSILGHSFYHRDKPPSGFPKWLALYKIMVLWKNNVDQHSDTDFHLELQQVLKHFDEKSTQWLGSQALNPSQSAFPTGSSLAMPLPPKKSPPPSA